jgi:hypothetical protein
MAMCGNMKIKQEWKGRKVGSAKAFLGVSDE